MKYNILIGGSAGQGMNTLSELLEKILKRSGYYVFSNKDYMSRVRGGHNFIQIRFGDEPITSHHPILDLILALDETTVTSHQERLKDQGVIVIDDGIEVSHEKALVFPLRKLAMEVGTIRVLGSVALGIVMKLFGVPMTAVDGVCNERFNEKISGLNRAAMKKGYELVETKFDPIPVGEDQHILISGNEAIALGALAAGVNFYAAYPMTPSTSIMTYLANRQAETGIVVEQAEDEIAAINMAIGGSYAGARAMTGTSGGGFSLMVEALGLAGIMETPLVVVNVQRPGPATGLPTRTEQSDLSFILTASHGEIPRMVLAVRDPEDAFYQTARALNIADKYQMLVIVLSDQYLADYTQTIKPYEFDRIQIERHMAGPEVLAEGERYKRYQYTESGISPRFIPGKVEGQGVQVDSDEHDESGHITESGEVRIQMMEKRMKRMEQLAEEIQEPEYVGAVAPEVLLIGWGSMSGPLKEAVSLLNEEGTSAGALVFGDIYPLPTKLLEHYVNLAKYVVNVEQNYTGQLAKLIRQETGIKCGKSILKYDGRQLDGFEIYTRVKKEVL